jgi:hypothetical protein
MSQIIKTVRRERNNELDGDRDRMVNVSGQKVRTERI